MKLTRKNIITILRREHPFLKNHFGVKRLAFFGSFANGRPNKNSDVDIFVEFSRPVGLRFIQMTEYLEKKLGRRIDVLTPGGIKGIRLRKVAQNIQRSMIYV